MAVRPDEKQRPRTLLRLVIHLSSAACLICGDPYFILFVISLSSFNQASRSTSLRAVDLTDLAGSTAPLKKFDPLGLANVGSEETFRWFQAS
jgi:hypothetical protein